MTARQRTPRQSVAAGTRVVTVRDIAFLGGWNPQSRHAGMAGTIISYETPRIQQRQVWREESYYVQLDGERSKRLLSRSDFVTVPDTLKGV